MLATAIDGKVKPRGTWFFQLERSSGNVLTLLEVAPRIAGAMAAHRMTGVNFPRLSLLMPKHEHIRILTNPGVERTRSGTEQPLSITYQV